MDKSNIHFKPSARADKHPLEKGEHFPTEVPIPDFEPKSLKTTSAKIPCLSKKAKHNKK